MLQTNAPEQSLLVEFTLFQQDPVEPQPVAQDDKKDKVYRLSRNFLQFPSDVVIPNVELTVKSIVAVAVGSVPYLVTNISMIFFRGCASLDIILEEKIAEIDGFKKQALQVVKLINGLSGALSATLMMGSAKVFSLSQKAVWGNYVEQPTGDGLNTRLAQYGATSLPWKDLKNIYQAFFFSDSLSADAWKLKEWQHITI